MLVTISMKSYLTISHSTKTPPCIKPLALSVCHITYSDIQHHTALDNPSDQLKQQYTDCVLYAFFSGGHISAIAWSD